MRAAMQQSALTGSAEPLVATLKQSDERLARADQPRLEPIRRAIARDLDRAKAASVADVATLSIKLDEVVRLVDELPLLSASEPQARLRRRGPSVAARDARAARGGRVGPRGLRRPGLARARPGRALLRRQHLVGDPLAGAGHADRASGGDAGRARAGVLPAREPEAAPAQRAPGAAGAPVRHRAGRPASARRARSSATSTARAQAHRAGRRAGAPGRAAGASAPACRAPTTRWPRSPPPAAGALSASATPADARRRSGSSCCSPWRWWPRRRSARTTASRRFYWGGWRLDVSLNLFLLVLVGTCFC